MILRKLQKEDLPTRVLWMNNPKVYGSMHFELPVTIGNTVRWFEKNQCNEYRYDACFEADNSVVAFGGLTSIDPVLRKAELYVFVNPDLQGTGFGTEATGLLLGLGFGTLGLHKIYLITNEDNHAAINVYRKCGFSLEGKHRDEYLAKDGVYRDRLYFGILSEEYGGCQ